jgi:hypothetical protein
MKPGAVTRRRHTAVGAVPPVMARLLLRQRDHAARWTGGETASVDRPLFPGLHGRPANPDAQQNIVKRHGIRSWAGRNPALADLAADLPPVVLADLLGIGITMATRWTGHARRDWAPYLADRHGQPDTARPVSQASWRNTKPAPHTHRP